MAISKKLIFSGLTAAAVLALAACGSNQNERTFLSVSVNRFQQARVFVSS